MTGTKTAVQEIEQAIATLEKLKLDSTPGEWKHWPEAGNIEIYSDWENPDSPTAEVVIASSIRPRGGWNHFGEGIYKDDYEPNAELIVTLHRTIDAQLELLHWGVAIYKIPNGQYPSPLETRVLALARAINGGSK